MFFDEKLASNKRVLAAVSGGADSVALFRLLVEMRDKGECGLIAAHYEHGIRGQESLDDAVFVQALCDRYGVPLVNGRADVPEIAKRSNEGLESCARRLRHAFLNETCDIYACDCIATAHHADDQAETVLMHLLRGTGPEGIKGIEPVSGRLIRPLLKTRKNDIYAYLRSIGQDWREDASNAENDNPRNIIRNEVMPKLEKAYPGAVDAINRYALSARLESRFITDIADVWYKQNVTEYPGIYKVDMSGDEALVRRAVRKIVGRDLTAAKLDEIIACRTATDVVNGIRAEYAGGSMFLIMPREAPYPALFNIEGVTELYGLCRFESSPSEPVPIRDDKFTQVLRCKALSGAVARTRLEGDFIYPFGMSRKKSFSDYLTDIKVPRPLRDIIPVIARGSEILWAVGCGISAKCAVSDGDAALRVACLPF